MNLNQHPEVIRFCLPPNPTVMYLTLTCSPLGIAERIAHSTHLKWQSALLTSSIYTIPRIRSVGRN